jgi:hypothetical protein
LDFVFSNVQLSTFNIFPTNRLLLRSISFGFCFLQLPTSNIFSTNRQLLRSISFGLCFLQRQTFNVQHFFYKQVTLTEYYFWILFPLTSNFQRPTFFLQTGYYYGVFLLDFVSSKVQLSTFNNFVIKNLLLK